MERYLYIKQRPIIFANKLLYEENYIYVFMCELDIFIIAYSLLGSVVALHLPVAVVSPGRTEPGNK